VRVADQRLAEESLDVLGHVVERELLDGALDVEGLRGELDAVARERACGETQEHGRVAGVTSQHESDGARLLQQQLVERRQRRGTHARKRVAMRAIASRLALVAEVHHARRIDEHVHTNLGDQVPVLTCPFPTG
jgi:hypothetical protein